MASVQILFCLQSPCTYHVIIYSIKNSDQTLIFTDTVLSHFHCHRQLKIQSKEAGGQLFARFDGPVIQIERATGPRPTDRRGRRIFVPNRLAERREIKRMFKEELYYVGDWHTHPEPQPMPSGKDIGSFQDMFRKSRHGLASFVMVIVGTASFPKSLFVGLCTSEGLVELIDPKFESQPDSDVKERS